MEYERREKMTQKKKYRLTGIIGKQSRRYEVRDPAGQYLLLNKKELEDLKKEFEIVLDF